MLDHLSEFSTQRNNRTGPLRLGVFATACVDIVPRAIARLAREVDDVDVRLVAVPDPVPALTRDDVDLAIMVNWDAENPDSTHLIVSEVRNEELVLMLPAGTSGLISSSTTPT